MVVVLLVLILLVLLFGAASVRGGIGAGIALSLGAVWYGGLAVMAFFVLRSCFA